MSEYTIDPDDQLLFCSRLVILVLDPLKTQLIKQHHAPPPMGHPGTAITYEILSRKYFWVNMREDVAQFIRKCHTCSRTKPSHLKPPGLLHPLQVPSNAREEVSID